MSSARNSDIREFLTSSGKLILNSDPSGTGKFLEEFFDYRNRIKQTRINGFIESLQDYFEQSVDKGKIHFDLLSEEEFSDLFEGVLKRVSQTNSITKIERFKLIIINHIEEIQPINLVETFLDLTSALHDEQVLILSQHLLLKNRLKDKNVLNENNTIRIQLAHENKLLSQNKENSYNEIHETVIHFFEGRTYDYYSLTKGNYLYYVQDLVSKALLIDLGLGGIETNPYDLMEITEFGEAYLRFISNS